MGEKCLFSKTALRRDQVTTIQYSFVFPAELIYRLEEKLLVWEEGWKNEAPDTYRRNNTPPESVCITLLNGEQTKLSASQVRGFAFTNTYRIKLFFCSQCFLQFSGSINMFRVKWDEKNSWLCSATDNRTQSLFKTFAAPMTRETPYSFVSLLFISAIDGNSILYWSQTCIRWWIAVCDCGNRRDGVWPMTPLLQFSDSSEMMFLKSFAFKWPMSHHLNV